MRVAVGLCSGMGRGGYHWDVDPSCKSKIRTAARAVRGADGEDVAGVERKGFGAEPFCPAICPPQPQLGAEAPAGKCGDAAVRELERRAGEGDLQPRCVGAVADQPVGLPEGPVVHRARRRDAHPPIAVSDNTTSR